MVYQPNGSLIAGFEGNQIIFWEKNGLRHGQFEVKQKRVQSMQFSKDSQVLSFFDPDERALFLYIRNNYQWQLKQTIDVQ